jgi:hypothetical protein
MEYLTLLNYLHALSFSIKTQLVTKTAFFLSVYLTVLNKLKSLTSSL